MRSKLKGNILPRESTRRHGRATRDGALFVTQDDRYDHRDQARDVLTGFGKIMHINPGRLGAAR
jgi:hypothetical protein